MKKNYLIAVLFAACSITVTAQSSMEKEYQFKPFSPPISYEEADKRADKILSSMTLEEKASIIGGHNSFYIKGFEKFGIPSLYLSDATQGVHIRKELSNLMEKSVAFPNPLALTATWNTELAYNYAKSIGEECRVGSVAVLLGPGMNIYRVSQNGRNFEYFGEDPFLAARMVENYVVGMQSTGTMATLKHFVCNNNDFHRRTTNAIVDERTLHEIYLPAFKAGVDAGAMAVMTSYNMLNGEWNGQSSYTINKLLRGDLGFKWLVMSDWWSIWDPQKAITSGQDLDMPGDPMNDWMLQQFGDIYVKTNAVRMVKEGKVTEAQIDRMVKSILRTCIAMGLYDRPVKDESLKARFPEHEKIALQTAREAMVLLRNEKNILPINKNKTVLLTGEYAEKIARGGGSAEVEGYNSVKMVDALKNEFGAKLTYTAKPTDAQIKNADIVILSIGTYDSEGWDRPFTLPAETEQNILNIASKNPNVVVVVNSGSGIRMTDWSSKVAAIVYAWYPGQAGNTALAEILAGKTNPSGKLPITIEKNFEDSPAHDYLPAGEKLYTGWGEDMNMKYPVNNLKYKEGVLVGYRWYDTKKIEPLFHFGYGLSYTSFTYSDIKTSKDKFTAGDKVEVSFTITNTGKVAGSEIAQLYVKDTHSSVMRPEKELKGFKKVSLAPGESKTITIILNTNDFSYWDESSSNWKAEPGDFSILVGGASNDIKLNTKVSLL
jgi:beta-glucosidase